jgi:hypothetical protein
MVHDHISIMSGPSPTLTRLKNATGPIDSTSINIDPFDLASIIWRFLKDVTQLNTVLATDLHVYKTPTDGTPNTITGCIATGTKFFDAVYYIALEDKSKVAVLNFDTGVTRAIPAMGEVQRNLLMLYLFIMFRGHYPTSITNNVGTDVPAFLKNMAGFTGSPIEISRFLASFEIQKVPIKWVKFIDTTKFDPAIQQRMALGTPGYRTMQPFIHYPCKPDAPDDAKAAYAWIRTIALQPPDWAIFPPTRSPALISRLKSLNNALGNLTLLCFEDSQINEMVSRDVKILFKRPTRDPKSDSWKSWPTITDLKLTDPIFPLIVPTVVGEE